MKIALILVGFLAIVWAYSMCVSARIADKDMERLMERKKEEEHG